ncbi:unnamed protein product [Trichogramma brassicae]|uniref:Uncharacterized protein n=1 Tax=Trichogramma brassicae TaxID=86971 RepID=A0A6H5J2U9_9HYME|nr:unnamed protein product [Trichogramma brassicae]
MSTILERPRSLRQSVNWEVHEERVTFLRRLCDLIRNWEGPIPSLGDVFRREEIENLLMDSVKFSHSVVGRPEKLIIEFVARSGYRDEPRIDENGGKPVLRRATPIHRAARRTPFDWESTVTELFKIHARLHEAFARGLQGGMSRRRREIPPGARPGRRRSAGSRSAHGGQRRFAAALGSVARQTRRGRVALLRAGADANSGTKLTPLQLVCRRARDKTTTARSSRSSGRATFCSERCGSTPRTPRVGRRCTTVLAASILVLASLWIVKLLLGCSEKRKNLIRLASKLPGPPTVPLIGNALHFACRPDETLDKVRELAKNYDTPLRFWLGPKLFVVLTEPQDYEAIAQKWREHKTVDKPSRSILLEQLIDHVARTDLMTDEQLRDETYTMFTADKVREEMERVVGAASSIEMEHLNELSYTEMVIKETMRLYPIAPLMVRQARGDISLETCTIPEGCSILMVPFATHRSAKYWRQPDDFLPERFSPENSSDRHAFAYVPFSAGIRGCIGANAHRLISFFFLFICFYTNRSKICHDAIENDHRPRRAKLSFDQQQKDGRYSTENGHIGALEGRLRRIDPTTASKLIFGGKN